VVKDVFVAYSINVPLSTFLPDATMFADVNVKDPTGIALVFIMWLQFWFFCLNVFHHRLEHNQITADVYPLTVVLEKIYAEPSATDISNPEVNAEGGEGEEEEEDADDQEEEGDEVRQPVRKKQKLGNGGTDNNNKKPIFSEDNHHIIGYTLHIFQRMMPDLFSIESIFVDMVKTDKVVDSQGFFKQGRRPEGAPDNNNLNIIEAIHPGGKPNQNSDYYHQYQSAKKTETPKLFTLYKFIHQRAMFNAMISIYRGVENFGSTGGKYQTSDDHVVPARFFDFEQGILLRDKRTCAWQLNVNSYLRRNPTGDNTSYYMFENIDTFYVLQPQFWNVGYMMTRMLPHVQFNQRHMAFQARLLRYAEVIKEREKAFLADIDKKLLEKSTQETEGGGRRRERGGNAADSAPVLGVGNKEAIGYTGPDGRVVAVINATDELGKLLLDLKRKPGKDVIADIIRFYGIISHCKGNVGETDKPVVEMDDKMTQMADLYRLDVQIFTRFWSVKADGSPLETKEDRWEAEEGLLKDMIQLRKMIFQKFKRDMTKETSDTSPAQKALNKYFNDNNLADKVAFKLPMHETHLRPWQQYMINRNQGFMTHCNVASGSRYILFGWIAASNRFTIEMKLHLNLIYSGIGGQGKSNQINVIKKNVLEETCTDILRTSKLHSASDGVQYDILECNDDLSFSKDLDDEKLGRMKSMATNCTDTGERLVPVTKEGGKIVYETQPYKRIKMGATLSAVNDSVAAFKNSSATNSSSIQAYLTRQVFMEYHKFNTFRQVSGSRANQASKTPDELLEDALFVDENIGAHCIFGWAWKLYFIGVMHIDMSQFEPVYSQLELIMKSMSLNLVAEHERVHEQAMIFCRCLPFISAFVDNHLVPTGMHYGKKFDVMQMMDWHPICTVDHIIFAFSFFLPSYYPEAMDTTLENLREIMLESFKLKEGKVSYKTSNKHEENNTNKHSDELLNALVMHAVSGNGTGLIFGGGSDNGNGNRMVQERERQKAAAAAVSKEEKIDATYVTFHYSPADLENRLASMNRGAAVEYSGTAIGNCLTLLSQATLESRPFMVSSAEQDTPVIDGQVLESYKRPAVQLGRFRVLVHYGLLNREKEYNGILDKILKMYAHKWFISRKILTGVPHAKYPWLMKTINAELNPDRMLTLLNYSFTPKSTFIIMKGTSELDKVAKPHQNGMLRQYALCDEDTVALVCYFETIPWGRRMGWRQCAMYHWSTRQLIMGAYIQQRMVAPKQGENVSDVICYPEDITIDYDKQEAVYKCQRDLYKKSIRPEDLPADFNSVQDIVLATRMGKKMVDNVEFTNKMEEMARVHEVVQKPQMLKDAQAIVKANPQSIGSIAIVTLAKQDYEEMQRLNKKMWKLQEAMGMGVSDADLALEDITKLIGRGKGRRGSGDDDDDDDDDSNDNARRSAANPHRQQQQQQQKEDEEAVVDDPDALERHRRRMEEQAAYEAGLNQDAKDGEGVGVADANNDPIEEEEEEKEDGDDEDDGKGVTKRKRSGSSTGKIRRRVISDDEDDQEESAAAAARNVDDYNDDNMIIDRVGDRARYEDNQPIAESPASLDFDVEEK